MSQNPQYHYLYGSVNDPVAPPPPDESSAQATASHNNNNTNDDDFSLDGEGLVMTDNEQDDPNTTNGTNAAVHHHQADDLQQLLLTTDNGNGTNSGINGGGNGHGRGPAAGPGTLLNSHYYSANNGNDQDKRLRGPCAALWSCCRGRTRQQQQRRGGGGGGGGGNDDRPARQGGLRNHPVLRAATWIGAVALVALCVAAVAFPNSRLGRMANSTSSSPTSSSTSLGIGGGGNNALLSGRDYVVPFPHIDRNDYNDPVANLIELDLIDPSFIINRGGGGSGGVGSSSNKLSNKPKQSPSQQSQQIHQSDKPTFVFPFPTGAFWTNLVLPPTSDRGLSFPVIAYPYAYKWSDKVLQVSYPAAHRKQEPKAIHDYFIPDLTFGTTEDAAARHVTAFDALSVTLQYQTSSGGGSWETYLVQGSPYVTLKYDNASPTIRALSTFDSVFCPRDDKQYSQLIDMGSSNSNSNTNNNKRRTRRLEFGICSTEKEGFNVFLRGVQFVIRTREGINWMVFSSEPIELQYDTQARTTIVSLRRFSGVLRLALLPGVLDPATASGTSTASKQSSSSSSSNQTSAVVGSSGLQRLIYHAGVYPVSGGVSWSFRSADSAASTLKGVAAKTISGAMGLASAALPPSPSSSSSTSSTSSSSRPASSVPGTGSGPSSRIGTVNFQFSIESFAPRTGTTSPVSLLMLALPHHAQSLPASTQLNKDKFDLVYRCIKGPMRPVLGSSWAYDEPLPMIGFDKYSKKDSSTREKKEYTHPVVRAEIVKSLEQDVKLSLPTLDENIYGYGKQTARLAQLAHIAHELRVSHQDQTAPAQQQSTNDTDSSNKKHHQHETVIEDEDKELTQVHDRAVELLAYSLEHLLTNNVTDYLVYDSNLGGLVTTDGMFDKEADFGNGRYNDHHFHYGYILYASAILGKIDSTFMQRFGAQIDALYYDVANNFNFASQKARGVYFPGARHKSWFDGHSFANGLFPFGNGKSQESSSEAVNCYYGAYLWSLVRHGAANDPESDTSPQTDFARLLLAMEIRGAQMYWHMTPPETSSSSSRNKSATAAPVAGTTTSVYSPSFSGNYMVGNLGMLDAVVSTWFGTEPLYVHMINEIPVTAITEDLFNRAYVKKEYANVLAPLGQVEMAWRGYVVCNHAVVDAQSAWKEALKIYSPELDSALSKSEVLYWIATRPEFNATLATSGQSPPTPSANGSGSGSAGSSDSSDSKYGSSSCAVHPQCSKLGLTGACCPPPGGTPLGCCNDASAAAAPSPSKSNSSDIGSNSKDGSSCAAHPACSKVGLTGACCPPTPNGKNLGCCKNR